MNSEYPPILKSATPAEVLEILRDAHRHQCSYDPEADPTIFLSRDTTIAKWREASDLVSWRRLGDAMNDYWKMELSRTAWRDVLVPARAHTVGEVCDLVARHTSIPQVRPARFFGSDCLPAGFFLTIRSMLAAEGADSSEIGPSTLLAPYTLRFPTLFLGPISSLAPGNLPAVKLHRPVCNTFLAAIILSGIAAFLGVLSGYRDWAVWPVLLGVTAYIAIWIDAMTRRSYSLQFGDLRTFRDLAIRMAEGPRAAP